MLSAFRGNVWGLVLTLGGLLSTAAFAETRLINGRPVEPGTYKEVIAIKSSGAGCTATVVGPRTIITAAHCADNGASASFTIDNKTYDAQMTRSSLYPAKDHDIAVGITSEDIKVQPVAIGGKANTGNEISLLGYGCIHPGGGGGNDGVLRIGETVITGFSNFDMVSRKAGGAALCFGDSGGPAMIKDARGKYFLIGINSKGNIQDTNYDTRTDIKETQDWLKEFTQKTGAVICGINSDCGVTPPPPPAPTCALTATPKEIKLGESLTVRMTVSGTATSGTIDGETFSSFPAQKILQPGSAGSFTAKGSVTGTGGSTTCETTYVVKDAPPPPPPPAPTCQLAAYPDKIKLGGTISLVLSVSGNATSATIDGTSVATGGGVKAITPTAKGTFSASGVVVGPGGTNYCSASYTVEDTTPPPTAPTCTLTANPNTVKVGENVALSLTVNGQANYGTIEGDTYTVFPALKLIKTGLPGTFTAKGSVSGPGGTTYCNATYVVINAPPPPPPPQTPSCQLTAIPDHIKLGETLTLEMSMTGTVTSAMIDNTPVAPPLGKKVLTPTAKGTFASSGMVSGPGGTSYCSTSYTVDDTIIPPPPPPPTPDYTVVPAYCGEDTLGSKVSTVCLAVLKRDQSMRALQISGAVVITYRDTSKEVLPIVYRKNRPPVMGDSQIYEDMTMYANSNLPGPQNTLILRTEQATVVKMQSGATEIPLAIYGRSASGVAFRVDHLNQAMP